MPRYLKTIIIWIAVLTFSAMILDGLNFQGSARQEISYSEFLERIDSGEVDQVTFRGDGITISGEGSGGDFFTRRPVGQLHIELIDALYQNQISFVADEPERQSLLLQLLIASFPLLLVFGAFYFYMRQSGGMGRNNPLSFGTNRAKSLKGGKVKTRFDDVAGCEEAKEEVREVVEFLQSPENFEELGAKIPRGVLLVGPPGTGKTLLARAIAGEAGVNFFSISGSDFVEMFVGVGASRVRNMFQQATEKAPCIVFVDEIDAVGRHRGTGMGGGHDEREQTLNQLLVEMDGFETNQGVIVIAATNRPDVLDPALLRPGRFDRQVVVDLPDIRGRQQILGVHTKQIRLDQQVDLSTVARATPGFSGADLANLVNEAALIAARTKDSEVQMHHLEAARDKVMMGTERKSAVLTESARTLTAYHEAGHAVVGYLVKEHHDPLYKVTIIPRGRAMGVTVFLPEEDTYSMTKQQLLARICTAYGGRIAEQLTFGDDAITTGASNDIEVATNMARNMVTKWGLSTELGPIRFNDESSNPFLGKQMAMDGQVHSEEVRKTIDAEVHRIITECFDRATKMLKDNRDKLKAIALALLEHETLESEQVIALMEGREMPTMQSGGNDKSQQGPEVSKPRTPKSSSSDLAGSNSLSMKGRNEER